MCAVVIAGGGTKVAAMFTGIITDLGRVRAVAQGAMTYSSMAKDAQAMANLANTAEQIIELIPF